MDNIDSLRQIPLFKDLNDNYLNKIRAISSDVIFNTGQRIFNEGDIGYSLYIVYSGSVRVLKKSHTENEEVAILTPGNHFGEMALIDEGTRSATLEAIEPTKLIQIKREDLENLLATDIDLAHQIYRTMAKYLCLRLRQTTKEYASTTEAVNMLNSYISQY